MEAYDVSKWVSVGIKGHLWNPSFSFICLQWTFVSEVWVLWNVLGGVPIRVSAFWHQMTHTTYALCVWDKLRARAFCSRGNGVRSVRCELFSFESSTLVCPFSRENLVNNLPPAALVHPLLRQQWDWDRGDRVISELSPPVCPAYEELLEFMEHATVRLDLQWRHEKGGVARSRLD